MKIKQLSIAIVLFAVIAGLGTCSVNNDITKVTVYLGGKGQAALDQKKLPIIDKIFELFVGQAYAQSIHQPADTAYYFLYVTGDDIETIYTPMISGSETSISIDVPSGDNRVFTLLSFSPSGDFNYVGQSVTDLTGEDLSISVNMYPCLNNISVEFQTGQMYISWTHDTTLSYFMYVNIYRACYGLDPLCDGTITPVQSLYPIGSPSLGYYYDVDDNETNDLIPDQEYIYFVSIDTGSFGEGEITVPANLFDFATNYYFISGYMMDSATYEPLN